MIPGTNRDSRNLKHHYDLSDFIDKFKTEKCFICGSGPSIGFLNLSDIHKHIVISVNASCLLMPWQHKQDIDRRYWISTDAANLKWDYFWPHVAKSHSTKIVRTSWIKHDTEIRDYQFRYFEPRNTLKPRLTLNHQLCGVSSVPAALDFAILMGCRQIYLLGVDHKIIDGKSHFWQFWPKKNWPKQKGRYVFPNQERQNIVFEKNVEAFTALNHYAVKQDITIKNCSFRSSLNIFPKISLEQALNEQFRTI